MSYTLVRLETLLSATEDRRVQVLPSKEHIWLESIIQRVMVVIKCKSMVILLETLE